MIIKWVSVISVACLISFQGSTAQAEGKQGEGNALSNVVNEVVKTKKSSWLGKLTQGNKESIGTGLGALIGVAIGNKLGTGHRDKDLATALGALIGSAVGNQIGAQLDERDRQLHVQMVNASLQGELGQTHTWANPSTQNKGTVTAVSAYMKDKQVCRDLDTIITTGNGQTDRQTVTGCQDADGGWTLAG